MRIKALITALVLGSTIAGVASAAPLVRDHREPAPVTYQQPRPSWMPHYNAKGSYGYQVEGNTVVSYNQGQDPYVEGIARGEWMTLFSNYQLPVNRESQVTLNLGGQRLKSIELQANGARSYISGVWVFMNDGRKIPMPVARYLDPAREPNLRLDLGPGAECGVKSILIAGFSRPGATFNIIGA